LCTGCLITTSDKTQSQDTVLHIGAAQQQQMHPVTV